LIDTIENSLGLSHNFWANPVTREKNNIRH
jgi:hypothetical protein